MHIYSQLAELGLWFKLDVQRDSLVINKVFDPTYSAGYQRAWTD